MFGEFVRRITDRVKSLCFQLLIDIRQLQDAVEFGIEPVDDSARRFARREHTVIAIDFISGQRGFSHSRHIRQRFDAFGRAHGERAQAACFDERYGCPRCGHQQLHLAADGGHGGVARAFIRDMHHVDFRHVFEQLDRQVAAGAGAGRGIVEIAGTRLGERNHFLDGFHRQRRMHYQHIGREREQVDAREIINGVVRQLGIQAGVEPVAGGYDQYGVAIGRGFGDDFRADDAGSTRAQIHQHLLAPVLGDLRAEQSRQIIVAATGGRRHDKTDGFARVGLRVCDRRGQHQRADEGDDSIHGCSLKTDLKRCCNYSS